jgi:hypothetical protein
MSQQTSGVTLRPDLYELAQSFSSTGAAAGYVGLKVLPLTQTAVESAKFPKMGIAEALRSGDTERAPRAAYGRGFSEFGSDEFSTKEYGWEEVVDPSFAKINKNYVNAEVQAVKQCTRILAESQEIRIRDIVYGQASHAVGTPWSTAATATPQANVRDACRSVQLACGMLPNSLVMTKKKMQQVLKTADFLDATKYTFDVSRSNLSGQVEAVRSFFDIQNLFIADGIYNTKGEGLTPVGGFIWDDDKAFLSVVGSGIEGDPHFGVTFDWMEDGIVGTETYEEPQTRAMIVRARNWRGEKVLLSAAGWKLTSL